MSNINSKVFTVIYTSFCGSDDTLYTDVLGIFTSESEAERYARTRCLLEWHDILPDYEFIDNEEDSYCKLSDAKTKTFITYTVQGVYIDKAYPLPPALR